MFLPNVMEKGQAHGSDDLFLARSSRVADLVRNFSYLTSIVSGLYCTGIVLHSYERDDTQVLLSL